MHECARRGLGDKGQDGEEVSAVAAIKERTDTNPHLEHKAHIEQQAARDFENHHIKSRGEGRWTIASKYENGKWCGIFLTEIIVGVNGTLIAHGDISPSIFVSHSNYDDPLRIVNWVAHSGIAGYLQSKASCGFLESYGYPLTKKFNEKVAIWELEGHLKDRLHELEEEHDGDENGDKEVAAWRKAIRATGGDPWNMVRDELIDDLERSGFEDCGEIVWDIGMVPADRLYYAQAACRKLLELLEEEKQD